jgi:two-component system CheB/CheR fusion protein
VPYPVPEASHPIDAQEAEWRAREGERLLIVGIGASAGGLEAFERFLRPLPADSGLAYVLVQHLDPEHESILTEILGRATHLSVEFAKDGQRIERDHVYVIPPGAGLLVEGGALRLVPTEHKGNRLLVNAFLTSLAEDQRENAVGIVLSGTGSDGALGITAVKKYGGNTFAQLPADARYGSMPAAAIATGMVEYVLPVDEIPAALLELAAERRRHPPESVRGETEGLRQAFELVARSTGHDFSRYKRSTILRRLRRRMAATSAATVRDYATLLEGDEGEIRRLSEDLTINVTSFFRDVESFNTLERIVIPDILERRRTEDVRTRSSCSMATSRTSSRAPRSRRSSSTASSGSRGSRRRRRAPSGSRTATWDGRSRTSRPGSTPRTCRRRSSGCWRRSSPSSVASRRSRGLAGSSCACTRTAPRRT